MPLAEQFGMLEDELRTNIIKMEETWKQLYQAKITVKKKNSEFIKSLL